MALVVLLNTALFTVIGATFYFQDYRYSLPTPRPKSFVPVKLEHTIELPHPDHRPALLCFASPDCGCSRFNQDHLLDLSRKFGRSVRFIEVIEAIRRSFTGGPPALPQWVSDVPIIGPHIEEFVNHLAHDPVAQKAALQNLISPLKSFALDLGKALGHGIFEILSGSDGFDRYSRNWPAMDMTPFRQPAKRAEQ